VNSGVTKTLRHGARPTYGVKYVKGNILLGTEYPHHLKISVNGIKPEKIAGRFKAVR
jgi:hypothetical protein